MSKELWCQQPVCCRKFTLDSVLRKGKNSLTLGLFTFGWFNAVVYLWRQVYMVLLGGHPPGHVTCVLGCRHSGLGSTCVNNPGLFGIVYRSKLHLHWLVGKDRSLVLFYIRPCLYAANLPSRRAKNLFNQPIV